jgi:hypothetical protein
MAVGRPVKYETKEEMQRIIDLYFLACKVRQSEDNGLLEGLAIEDLEIIKDIEGNIPTVAGLAYALNMTRETIRCYGEKDEFSDTIKRAKQRIEISLEQRLAGNNVTGAIFNLKNNFGWKDKTEQELSGPDGGAIEVVERRIIGKNSKT